MTGPGTLRIEDRAVEKIVKQAVREVGEAAGVRRAVLGVPVGRSSGSDQARVGVQVHGGVVSVDVLMAVRWPQPVRRVSDDTRRHVRERVTGLTGLDVAEVDITVSHLPGEQSAGRVN